MEFFPPRSFKTAKQRASRSHKVQKKVFGKVWKEQGRGGFLMCAITEVNSSSCVMLDVQLHYIAADLLRRFSD